MDYKRLLLYLVLVASLAHAGKAVALDGGLENKVNDNGDKKGKAEDTIPDSSQSREKILESLREQGFKPDGYSLKEFVGRLILDKDGNPLTETLYMNSANGKITVFYLRDSYYATGEGIYLNLNPVPWDGKPCADKEELNRTAAQILDSGNIDEMYEFWKANSHNINKKKLLDTNIYLSFVHKLTDDFADRVKNDRHIKGDERETAKWGMFLFGDFIFKYLKKSGIKKEESEFLPQLEKSLKKNGMTEYLPFFYTQLGRLQDANKAAYDEFQSNLQGMRNGIPWEKPSSYSDEVQWGPGSYRQTLDSYIQLYLHSNSRFLQDKKDEIGPDLREFYYSQDDPEKRYQIFTETASRFKYNNLAREFADDLLNNHSIDPNQIEECQKILKSVKTDSK
ncbi:hypothetical protein KY366_07875 [Candidatus Woesearchaeota archaeon]|nr:hypothetical protein [Candidatus Woesearchaeota archaeon]